MKRRLTKYCKRNVSFIFQQLHLIIWLSIKNNIELPQYFGKTMFQDKEIDVSGFNKLKISSLSLGQQQRIAFLRACCYCKKVLLCDEPTGSLDQQNAKIIMQLLKKESKEKLVVIVSHDLKKVQEYCDEIYEMRDGKIVNHTQIHASLPPMTFSDSLQKKKRLSYLRLSLSSLFSNKRRTFQMLLGFSLSLFCVLITLTMSQNLEKQIEQYIYSLVPPQV